jgi:antitoxin MazE
MKALVKKWGNSASVRIPVAVMQAARLELDQEVDVREEEGRIIIEPLRPQGFELFDLLEGISEDNLHGEVDFGKPVGREVW